MIWQQNILYLAAIFFFTAKKNVCNKFSFGYKIENKPEKTNTIETELILIFSLFAFSHRFISV